ncbi:endo-beta-1,4-xylanase-like protein [Cercophora newfieldiana]|uniref:endo-1,4-beta-xylanase n=1 Tax=Cercophora newfieldiana TaxID=92897 RepID=A0AA40CVQ5_9PEZI|nr:endo-beta-1,4-xylanase-like protein [Cercophora newfieldiana]
MASLKYFAFCAAAALAIPVTPEAPELVPRGTAVGNGEHDGFFYNFWTDGGGHVTYQNKANGAYSVDWQDCSSFFGGKGWNPGRMDRNITFSGRFNAESNAYLSVYGTTRNPKVEYYVIEDYGSYDPTLQFAGGIQNGREGGTIQVDGGSYKIGYTRHTFMVPVGGDSVVTRVYSVRSAADRRASGTVNMQAHFDAWIEKLGLRVGTMEFQIVATEGYKGSGEAEITVSKRA